MTPLDPAGYEDSSHCASPMFHLTNADPTITSSSLNSYETVSPSSSVDLIAPSVGPLPEAAGD